MDFLEKMRTIQKLILEFLDSEEENESNFDDLTKLLSFQPEQLDIQELKSILYLISKISKNHHRGPFFLRKIKKIIIHLKEAVKQTFSNIEIFNFFKKNNLILLLLIKEDILMFDSIISNKISEYKFYFYPEIRKIDENENSINLPEDYEERRIKGENDSYLCEIIRNDDIENFVIHYNRNHFQLSTQIESSIYETNSFLKNKVLTLIEYSVFFGSIQIIRFLFQNNVVLKPSLWIYAIHSNNPEIIHFLEENGIRPDDLSYKECLKESIKCHHLDFASYFKDNFIKEDDYSFANEVSSAFRFYNYQFIPLESTEKRCFYYAIEYDHYNLVEFYKNIEGLDINEKLIYKIIFIDEISKIIINHRICFMFNKISNRRLNL